LTVDPNFTNTGRRLCLVENHIEHWKVLGIFQDILQKYHSDNNIIKMRTLDEQSYHRALHFLKVTYFAVFILIVDAKPLAKDMKHFKLSLSIYKQTNVT
jgi:hypothetical protein